MLRKARAYLGADADTEAVQAFIGANVDAPDSFWMKTGDEAIGHSVPTQEPVPRRGKLAAQKRWKRMRGAVKAFGAFRATAAAQPAAPPLLSSLAADVVDDQEVFTESNRLIHDFMKEGTIAEEIFVQEIRSGHTKVAQRLANQSSRRIPALCG